MTTSIKAQIIRRTAHGLPGVLNPRVRHPDKPWAARAVAVDEQGQVIRSTVSGYAATHAEALQLAQLARQTLDDTLMAEVHASRASSRRTCPTCQHDAPALGHDTASPRCIYHRADAHTMEPTG